MEAEPLILCAGVSRSLKYGIRSPSIVMIDDDVVKYLAVYMVIVRKNR